jgi:cardiolipin synthase
LSPIKLSAGHQVQLLQSGEEFFPALVRALDSAVREVRLETYIFHFDATGDQVAAALAQAAERGASVYLVMDAIGTPHVPQSWVRRFAEAGVRWRLFSPLGRFGLLIPVRWRRLHRKLCVVDGRIAFCGGINILDDHIDPDFGKQSAARFDFAVQVQGPLVAEVQAAMSRFWSRLPIDLFRRQSVASAELPSGTGALAGLVLRDNLRNRNSIERMYRKAIADARSEIVIANAYFLPGGKLRRALIHAAKRGVRVRLLLHGTYESFMQYHASRPVLGVLLNAGVEIHEYQAGFLHAKVAVVDGYWATVGSSNLDPLSLLLAREANLVIADVPFSQALRAKILAATRAGGVQLHFHAWAARPLRRRCLDWFAFGLMRFLLLLTGKRY